MMGQSNRRSTAPFGGAAGRAPSTRPLAGAGVLLLLLSGTGCVSDATLLDENSSVALRSARFQARQDLSCPKADVALLSEQEVPGAPWGYLYSDYRIRAQGCGGSATYKVECRDESLCDVTREKP